MKIDTQYIHTIKAKIEAYLKSPKDYPYYGNLFKDTLLIIQHYEQETIQSMPNTSQTEYS